MFARVSVRWIIKLRHHHFSSIRHFPCHQLLPPRILPGLTISAGCYRKNDRNLITFDGRMRLVTAKMIRSALHTSSNGSKNRPPSIAQCFAHQPAKYTFYVSASSLFQHIFTTNTKFYFRFVSVHLRFHICVKFS